MKFHFEEEKKNLHLFDSLFITVKIVDRKSKFELPNVREIASDASVI